MGLIFNNEQGIKNKAAFNAIKATLHPGFMGKLRIGISLEEALQMDTLILLPWKNQRCDGIVDLDFLKFFPSLTVLSIESKGLSNIDGLKFCPNLIEVELGSDWLRSLDFFMFRECKKLESILVYNPDFADGKGERGSSSTDIRNIDTLAQLPELVSLNLFDLGIRDIRFVQSMQSVKEVYLDGNPISDFSPLQGHPSVELLGLHRCGVTDISFLVEIPALKRITVSKNNIRDFSPLKEMKNLKNVAAWGNGLSSHEIEKWKNELQHIKELELED